VRYLYHDPCHSPMKQQDPVKTVNGLLGTADGTRIARTDRCCGEAGTLAVTRADISTQVRMRKEAELDADAQRLRAGGFEGPVRVLTSCPSCLQGLSRFEDTSAVQADYLVVELAQHLLGANWMAEYVARANDGGIERVLV
jgi:Fe-S oxidoreductase